MRLTLVLPSLIWPQALDEEMAAPLTPGLSELLAAADPQETMALGPEEWLAKKLGLTLDSGVPLAPLVAPADGITPGPDYWLFAEPVHLNLGHDDVILGPSLSKLPETEARPLLDSLNAHFTPDRWRFCRGDSGRWYLALPSPPMLATFSPRQARRRPVRHYLPRGEAARPFARALTEIQMLLHAHPVNAERAARGEAVINSLWFWGGGISPAPPPRADLTLVGGSELMVSLAAACGATIRTVPPDGAAWQPAGGDTVLWLGQLDAAQESGDLPAWSSALQTVDAQWIMPLLARADRGEFELSLLACGRDRALLVQHRRRRWIRRLLVARRQDARSVLGQLAARLDLGPDAVVKA